MNPLDPGQLGVLRVRAALAAIIVMVPIAIAELAWLRGSPVPGGLASAAAAAALVAAVLILPRRRYRSWAYRMDEDELHIGHGLWTRVRTVVPFGRVQHIDVEQGPIERAFGVATLVLHTAGTRSSAVSLPGLSFADAGRMRDVIRSKIRQELA